MCTGKQVGECLHKVRTKIKIIIIIAFVLFTPRIECHELSLQSWRKPRYGLSQITNKRLLILVSHSSLWLCFRTLMLSQFFTMRDLNIWQVCLYVFIQVIHNNVQQAMAEHRPLWHVNRGLLARLKLID